MPWVPWSLLDKIDSEKHCDGPTADNHELWICSAPPIWQSLLIIWILTLKTYYAKGNIEFNQEVGHYAMQVIQQVYHSGFLSLMVCILVMLPDSSQMTCWLPICKLVREMPGMLGNTLSNSAGQTTSNIIACWVGKMSATMLADSAKMALFDAR